MTMDQDQGRYIVRRPRRRHDKSKLGCFECKRRKVKCDENKPSCTRCTLGLTKCVYPFAAHPPGRERKYEFRILSSSPSSLPISSSTSPHVYESPLFWVSPIPEPTYVHVDCVALASTTPKTLLDADLHNHYLEHTSRTLSLCQSDYDTLHIGMPMLAKQSKTVLHSLLAVSAASLAWSMIEKDPDIDTHTVNQVLLTGYQHYNLASERMREAISRTDVLEPGPLIAGALMLIPFATSSQQTNNWISSRSGAQSPHKPLPSTPRNVMVMMRGIRTMLQTLDCAGPGAHDDLRSEKGRNFDVQLASPAASLKFSNLAPSRTHFMNAIVASTSQSAFSKLKNRLYSAQMAQIGRPNSFLSACSAAFDIMEDIRSTAFSTTCSSASPLFRNPKTNLVNHESTCCSRIAPWLRSFAGHFFPAQSTAPRPTEPLTRFFLSFLVQVPQEYLDLTLPLLDQRLERPIGTSSDRAIVNLTQDQTLALDIYAHWSVLMFLVEEESWWIGKLPEATLTGMVNRYGTDFVNQLWPEIGYGEGQWWPGSMLNILRETKRHR
ncbi:hypothetical protein CC86DRAFT_366046 [Ophiobolus disseminans]|uniref:Zn(2)-C6 fungal-type domain-containing protein n=1 Tax=Ophiobolus disseminans TaxID=1469910 RepID=A0A6A7AGW4_9PLEO|nr:hypothetical protein CC86DRAFT_366046 [Ophiobolus disseminans]